MTILYLIRHGETDYVGHKLSGWLPGIHLNERGQRQVARLAEELADVPFAALYASPLDRTIETARPIAASHHLRIVRRPRLGELDPGEWAGQSLKSLRRRKLWPVIQRSPSLARFPGGESFLEAQERIVAELEALRKAHPRPETIVGVVSHADMIKLALAHYIGLPLDQFQRLTIEPASISILSVGDSLTRLLHHNDTRASRPPAG
jgi:probable phosphomutase (TIGR03848 family)